MRPETSTGVPTDMLPGTLLLAWLSVAPGLPPKAMLADLPCMLPCTAGGRQAKARAAGVGLPLRMLDRRRRGAGLRGGTSAHRGRVFAAGPCEAWASRGWAAAGQRCAADGTGCCCAGGQAAGASAHAGRTKGDEFRKTAASPQGEGSNVGKVAVTGGELLPGSSTEPARGERRTGPAARRGVCRRGSWSGEGMTTNDEGEGERAPRGDCGIPSGRQPWGGGGVP
mmetsp:Transcript_32804/g.100789  ORF Transcript_32804/g.100789 Transcript_32804/m.100789 type:complete len:225 (-) Transcript_32804:18-692(-)